MATGDKPVTMPVKPREMAPKKLSMEREISPDSIVRSSSSSYHSASIYDEPDEHFSSTRYSYNAEYDVPQSLIQSKGPAGSSDRRASLKRQLQPGNHTSQYSSGHLSSDSPTAFSSDQTNPNLPQSFFAGSGSMPTASLKHASAGMGATSAHKALRDGEMSPLLVQEFQDAVKVWNNEAVERVLIKDEQVVDTVFTMEVISCV